MFFLATSRPEKSKKIDFSNALYDGSSQITKNLTFRSKKCHTKYEDIGVRVSPSSKSDFWLNFDQNNLVLFSHSSYFVKKSLIFSEKFGKNCNIFFISHFFCAHWKKWLRCWAADEKHKKTCFYFSVFFSGFFLIFSIFRHFRKNAFFAIFRNLLPGFYFHQNTD